ncbi:MAG: hypothetical protein WKG07_25440 [Hymenobacter sp.]
MFSTGFSMEAAAQAEPIPGPTADLDARRRPRLRRRGRGQRRHARRRAPTTTACCGCAPTARTSRYDKRHLFTGGRRARGVHRAASTQLIEEWRGWRIKPAHLLRPALPGVEPQPARCALRPAAVRGQLAPAARRNLARPCYGPAPLRTRRIRPASTASAPMGPGRLTTANPALLDMQGDYLAQAGNLQTVLTHTLQATPCASCASALPVMLDADDFSLSSS